VLFACFATLAFVAAADAREEILTYDSQIDVARDGTLTVTETIVVNAEGKKIKRGIYRDFPTTYEGRLGTRVIVPFDVVSVERDGKGEPHHLEKLDDGIRVYIGNANRQVAKGQHTYKLTYRTRRQLGFFDEHDELYWNVTGNFWDFPIQKASATIRLPGSVEEYEIAHEGSTGPVGSRNRDLRSWANPENGEFRFETTQALARGHGLTVVAMFPKGLVREPSKEELQQAFYDANRMFLIAGAGAAVVLLYYLATWGIVGRDPSAGIIIPRFEPPRDMSPACMRHLLKMGYDSQCFATALVSMAVKGFLSIEEKHGEYTLVRGDADRSVLSQGERRIAAKLLTGSRFKLEISRHAKIRGAIERFKNWLSLEQEGVLFLANRWWIAPGIAISIAAVLCAGLGGGSVESAPAAFLMVWLSGWTLGLAGLLREAFRRWQGALHSPPGMQRIGAWIGAIFLTAFATPFLGAEVMALFMLAKVTSPWMVGILLGIIGANFLFYSLLKRPTLAGRRLMDEIEGFKMYLRTAEGDEIRRLEAPKPTPELFERYLPYAMALDVENEWSERFSEVLERAGDGTEHGYSPDWYQGDAFRSLSPSDLGASIGSSLASAVSSTSTAPGSSSGGGGGGSSGGGGGGGGGGGW
jgi:uncharacterized membrane protein YgcG